MNQEFRIGFIGTGLMGAPMVRRLRAAGFPVTIWNRSAEKSEPLRDSGATVAAVPADVARDTDIICLCVTDAAAVEAVVFGTAGLATAASSGQVLIDFSSIRPEATLSLSSRLHDECNADWIDAPVSGGTKGAEVGRLIIMCGGEPEVITRVQPVFDAVAQKVTRIGGVGAGQLAKLCNQVIVATNILSISEAIVLGEIAGIDVDRLPEALAGGWADSLPLQIIGPHLAGQPAPQRIGALSTMLKDVDSALDTAGAARATMRITESVASAYRDACTAIGESADLPALREFYAIDKE